MADVQKTVEIIFAGVDRVSSVSTDIGRGLDSLGNKLGDVTAPLATVTNAIAAVDTALGGLAAVALGFSIRESVAFQDALADLLKVLDPNETAIDEYKASISDLASQFGVMERDVLASVTSFRQAGFGINDALVLTETALRANKVAELDVRDATNLLVGSLQGFQLTAADAPGLLDRWNSVSDASAAKTIELANAFNEVAPVARLAGLSVDETIGFVTPIINVFQSGSESGRGLKTALLSLIEPSSSTRQALEQLGVSQTNANGELRSAKDILLDIIPRWSGLSDATRLYIAQLLIGKDQATKFVVAMEGMKDVTELTAVSMNSAGSATAEWERRQGTAQVQVDRLQVAVSSAARTLGDQFLVGTTDAARGATDLFLAIRQMVNDGALEPFLQLIRPLLEDFATTLEAIARNLPAAFAQVDFDRLINAFGTLGESFSNLFGGVDLTTTEGLANALQRIADALAGLINVSAGIVNALAPVFAALADGVQGFSNLDAKTQETIGEVLGFGRAINALAPAVSSLGTAIEALAGIFSLRLLVGLRSVGGEMGLVLTRLGQAGLLGAAAAGGYEVGKLADSWFGLSEKLANVIEWFLPLNDGLEQTNVLVPQLTDNVTLSAEAIRNAADAFGPYSAGVSDIGTAFDDVFGQWEAAVGANEALKDSFAGAGLVWDEATGQLRRVAEAAGEGGQAFQSASDAFGPYGAGLTDITGAFDEAATANGRWVQTVVDGVPTFTQVPGTLAKVKTATDATKESTDKARQAANDFKLKMEEIASNERIKLIEARVELNTAQIEADTERVKAAFESLNTTIESTGDVIGAALGALRDVDPFNRDVIIRQLELENQRRDEALRLQRDLTQAQIDALNARTAALNRGDSVIQVDGSGLEPHIEAFMFEILKAIQVRANAEASEFLLGI